MTNSTSRTTELRATPVALIGTSARLAPGLVARLAAEQRRTVLSPAWPPAQSQERLCLVIAETATPAALTATVRRSSAVPLLIVTTATQHERIQALDHGADICLTAAEEAAVVGAHAVALLRRDPRPAATIERIEAGRVVLEMASRSVTVNNRPLTLSRREFDLLAHLARQPNRVFRRHDLLAAVWGPRFVGESNTVDVHVAWLRQKLPADCGIRVTTLRGVGYRLDVLA